MHKRSFLSGFSLLLCALMFFAAAFYWRIYRNSSMAERQLLFAKTLADRQTDRIVIKNADYILTLVRGDNYWNVAEADFYYANSLRLEKLLAAIAGAACSRCLKENDSNRYGFPNGVEIRTYSGDKLLNAYVFGNYDIYNQFRFFQPLNENKICLTDAEFDFPEQFYSWLQQPLMQLQESDVSRIKITSGNGRERLIARTTELRPLQETDNGRTVNLQNFFDVTGYLSFTNVLSAADFAENPISVGKIDITLFSGLIYNLHLFRHNGSFWLQMNLSSTALPTEGIGDYIKDNAFLYDGWYFRLSASKGSVLSDFIAD